MLTTGAVPSPVPVIVASIAVLWRVASRFSFVVGKGPPEGSPTLEVAELLKLHAELRGFLFQLVGVVPGVLGVLVGFFEPDPALELLILSDELLARQLSVA